ncbi:MAG: hypothetical protein KatS3mg109_0844 [Pirellulaceae bacterium]|jgi:hypothetical protein|nr:DUF1887 family protein [Chloroflexota bacterium]GIW90412.1 MAG: hypothetical protein KatS3mg109_0844 [Pirellulaceae bacterium]
MTKTALILLVGEQPLPNLLPTRHINPAMVVLVHTDRTEEIAKRLKGLLSAEKLLCQVEPYDLLKIKQTLQDFLSRQIAESEYQLLFNLTGGTKPMSIAAFRVASRRKAPFVYFQTEGGRSLLYHYQFTDQGEVILEKQEEISQTIDLDDYLRAQVGNYTTEDLRDDFEREVHRALQKIPGLEIFTSVRPLGLEALEVDFVVSLGNQIGVIEAKKKGAKSGIDQIQAVAEQRYLGTYVAKFLVSGKHLDRNNKNLAQAYRIEVIELTSYASNRGLSEDDQNALKQRVLERLRRGG